MLNLHGSAADISCDIHFSAWRAKKAILYGQFVSRRSKPTFLLFNFVEEASGMVVGTNSNSDGL
jgi:hypothetical protein